MSKIFLLLFFFGCLTVGNTQPARHVFVNPTGTYLLKGEKHKNEIKGNFGEIRVKLLGDSVVALTMYSNKGYPDYSSASFSDTLPYVDNQAIHTSRADPSCQMVFAFETEGLNIKQIYTDPASTCGFEKGVIPLGFISKYSSDIPIIQSLSRLR